MGRIERLGVVMMANETKMCFVVKKETEKENESDREKRNRKLGRKKMISSNGKNGESKRTGNRFI